MRTAKAERHRRVHYDLSQFILGGQDGLVNVLTLALGVASATFDSRIVIISGLAATIAESISMAAVAYTSAKAGRDYYRSEFAEERAELRRPGHAATELRAIYAAKGFAGRLLDAIVSRIAKKPKIALQTIISERQLIAPEAWERPVRSAAVVGSASIVGSLVPLAPFFAFPIKPAMAVTVLLSIVALYILGATKARLTLGSPFRAGIELMGAGIFSAIVGYGIGALLGIAFAV